MQKFFIFTIQVYQWTLRSFIGQHCRFFPTCSDYAIEALEKHGSLRGLRLILLRLGRCHPFAHSGYDPVPETVNRGQKTRLLNPMKR